MKKIEDDGTRPLPETAELGGEGGSFGDSASRESRRHPGNPMPPVEGAVTDVVGNVMRLPDVDDQPAAGKEVKKYPTDR
jgi:hypothetical protein